MSSTAPQDETEWSSVEDVSFTADADGTEQKYVRCLPASFQPAGPHGLLLVLHGHGSDRWQYVADPRDECRAARDAAVAHDLIYVSPDYRAATSWMGPHAEADVVQIIRDLKAQFEISEVIVCGASMGGAASLTFAVLHPEIADGVVSMNGTANFLEFNTFPDAVAESFGGTKEELPEEYRRRSAEFWPGKLTMPLGITLSGRDACVPPGSILRLAESLKQDHQQMLLIYREEEDHVTTYDDAREALEFVIGCVL